MFFISTLFWQLTTVIACLEVRLWACGRGDVSAPSFGSHLNPISTRGGRFCPPYTGVHTKFWKPQARLMFLCQFMTRELNLGCTSLKCNTFPVHHFTLYVLHFQFSSILSSFWITSHCGTQGGVNLCGTHRAKVVMKCPLRARHSSTYFLKQDAATLVFLTFWCGMNN